MFFLSYYQIHLQTYYIGTFLANISIFSHNSHISSFHNHNLFASVHLISTLKFNIIYILYLNILKCTQSTHFYVLVLNRKKIIMLHLRSVTS